PAASAANRWAGAYVAKPGAVLPPKNANEKTWQRDPGTAAIGAGTIELAIGPRGDALGSSSGALGDLALSGSFDGKELRATATPRDPNAPGAMTGALAL